MYSGNVCVCGFCLNSKRVMATSHIEDLCLIVDGSKTL